MYVERHIFIQFQPNVQSCTISKSVGEMETVLRERGLKGFCGDKQKNRTENPFIHMQIFLITSHF